MNSRGLITGIVRGCCGLLFTFLFSLASFGQAGRGSVSGTVTDPGGALIAGAEVTLKNPATGVSQHTVTSSAGLYTFISLNPGVYQVNASQTGFKGTVRDNITVNVDQVTEVNITLQVGAQSETVTVAAGTELVEATNSTVGSLIGSETIDRVPLLYRNVYDLIQLSAGVTPPNGSPNSSDSMQWFKTFPSAAPESTSPPPPSTARSSVRSTTCSMAAPSGLPKIIPPPSSLP